MAGKDKETLLRKALVSGVCYTTMLNALELFRAAKTKEQSDAILQMLMVVRVLGFNARFAQSFADTSAETQKKTGKILSNREAMIIGMAKASKLTILTEDFFERYDAIGAVPVARSCEEVPTA